MFDVPFIAAIRLVTSAAMRVPAPMGLLIPALEQSILHVMRKSMARALTIVLVLLSAPEIRVAAEPSRDDSQFHVSLIFDNDRFAAGQPITLRDDLSAVRFQLETDNPAPHIVELRVAGPGGDYLIRSSGRA